MEPEPYPNTLIEILEGFALVVLVFGAIALAAVFSVSWRDDPAIRVAVGAGVPAATALLWAAFKTGAVTLRLLWRLQYEAATEGRHDPVG